MASNLLSPLGDIAALGGPVLVLLLAVSVFTLTVALLKTWQHQRAHVGRRRHLQAALECWDRGDAVGARESLSRSRHFLAPVVELGITIAQTGDASDRLESEAEQRFAPLEKGFRILDTVAQLAPLLGLLGTVLGMIEAFRALQDAGPNVDPSVLAGGIWVALLTTAAGLSVAMPVSVVLSWFESRIDAERGFADYAVSVLTRPAKVSPDGA